MPLTVEAITNGTTYSLSDRNPFVYLKEDGIGMAPLHRLAERGPQQHGDSDVGFWLDPRLITLVIGFEGSDESDYYDIRQTLLDIFSPADDPVLLRFTLPNGAVRQIDVHYVDSMTFSSELRYGVRLQKVGIILRADDPLFYDPDQNAVTFSLGGGGSAFAIPMTIPLSVGASTLDESLVLAYAGSFREKPVILITGPITDPIIENESTGEVLDFTGTTIAALDTYTIDTRFGALTVVDAAGANQIADLTDDSDLASFHLASAREVVDGNNSIRVTGSSVTAATTVYLRYYDRYLGH